VDAAFPTDGILSCVLKPPIFLCRLDDLFSVTTFLLAVGSEGMHHGQEHIRNSYLMEKPKRFRKTIMTILFGFQQLMGWMLMLISMTFSIELFASVLVGLFVGKLLFQKVGLFSHPGQSPRRSMISGHASDNANDHLMPEEPPNQQSPSSDRSSTSAVRRRRRL